MTISQQTKSFAQGSLYCNHSFQVIGNEWYHKNPCLIPSSHNSVPILITPANQAKPFKYEKSIIHRSYSIPRKADASASLHFNRSYSVLMLCMMVAEIDSRTSHSDYVSALQISLLDYLPVSSPICLSMTLQLDVAVVAHES